MSQGSDETFQALCRAEYPALVRTAFLMTGNRDEALDLAQETLARAFERWRNVSKLDKPGVWLQRVVANLAISWRRRRRVQDRARRLELVEASPPPGFGDPALIDALRTLTPSQRAVVVLRYCADQSIDEVARLLGKRPGTVTALASQGLARLRSQLRTEEVTSEAGR